MKAHSLAACCAAILIASCGASDPKAVRVTSELLQDQTQLQAVSNRLEPADREAFGRYALNRSLTSTGMVRPLVDAQGRDPETVGDAIALVRQWEARKVQRDAITAERDAKIAVLRAKRERLSEVAEAAGWAPPQTQAANAVIAEIEAVEAEYAPRIEALR